MSLKVLILLAVTAQRVSAHIRVTTTALCQNESWMFNSRSQSPCLIAAWLQAPCFGWSFEVHGLNPGHGPYYPAGNGTDPCTCSTVTFSMISACGLCQNDSAGNWSAWSVNCSDPSLQQYARPLPNQTVVQDWAYLPLSNDTLDVVAARNDDGPKSTASAPPTTVTATAMITTTASSPNPNAVVSSSISTAPPSTTSTSSTGVSTTSTSPTPSYSSTSSFPSVSHKSLNAGAVVGGFVVLGVIGSVIAMFLSHRRHNQLAPSSEYGVQNTQPIDVPPQSPLVPPMTQENSPGI